MENLFITHPVCAAHAMGDMHPESPERLEAIEQALTEAGLLQQMTRLEATPATRDQLMRAHSPAHVNRIFDASPPTGLIALDPDTAMNPYTLDAALHAAGAATMAVDHVCSGRSQRAFCCVRPPGHHAERDRPMGFCFFNNVAVAALHALDEFGLQRIAIVDFDVHHGNGTEDIFQSDPRVLMTSSFQSGLYPGSGEEPLGSNMHNVPLDRGSGGPAVQAACQAVWIPAIKAFEPELILISAGFDAHAEDQLAGLQWTDQDYHWLTLEIIRVANQLGHGRVISILEGGYALSALGRSVALHVAALVGET